VHNSLAADLDHVLAHTAASRQQLRGGRLFITGGTGFIGCWLLESLVWANDRLGLDADAVVLTRNPDAFAHKAPHLAQHPRITLHAGDVRSFDFPDGKFSHVIHAATESATTLNADEPLAMLDTIVRGTERALDFARHCGAARFLLTSSGAVYGRQPPEIAEVPEDFTGAPDPCDPHSAYGEGKRVAEHLCTLYHRRHGLQTTIARCFAFIGPYLPLDAHFAAGNFLRDGLAGKPIRVQGDGTPMRSYLYAADLAIALWTILTHGSAGRPCNVGGDRAVSIADLARAVAAHFAVPVSIARPAVNGTLPARYVPNVTRARNELGLCSHIALADAIDRTARWHQQSSQVSEASEV
jgi:nucleoside-diphosphate-sugar epimerase